MYSIVCCDCLRRFESDSEPDGESDFCPSCMKEGLVELYISYVSNGAFDSVLMEALVDDITFDPSYYNLCKCSRLLTKKGICYFCRREKAETLN